MPALGTAAMIGAGSAPVTTGGRPASAVQRTGQTRAPRDVQFTDE
jgi:hypothetical protein